MLSDAVSPTWLGMYRQTAGPNQADIHGFRISLYGSACRFFLDKYWEIVTALLRSNDLPVIAITPL